MNDILKQYEALVQQMEKERALTLKALADKPEVIKAVEALYARLERLIYAPLRK